MQRTQVKSWLRTKVIWFSFLRLYLKTTEENNFLHLKQRKINKKNLNKIWIYTFILKAKLFSFNKINKIVCECFQSSISFSTTRNVPIDSQLSVTRCLCSL